MAEYTRLYQAATPDLFTYQDALEHLEATTLGGAMDSERRDFRSAVLGAYPDLASRYDWLYFHTEHDIRLEATYSTGTIAYCHTGHSNERQVSLGHAGATITVGTSTVSNLDGLTIILTSSDSTAVTYTLDDDSVLNTGSAPTVGISGVTTAEGVATNLASIINTSHSGKITASASGTTVTLLQVTAGADGNTSITGTGTSSSHLTVSSAFAGGSSGALWPSGATEGRVKISDVRYPVAKRVSDTIITLPDSANPGEDIASATSYTWLKTSYTLPADFKDMDPPHTENSYFNQRPVSLDSIMAFERHVRASSNPPRWYAVGPDPNRYGQMAMYVQYEPNTAEGLRFFYRRFPRRLKYSDISTGTVSTSGTTVTLTGPGSPSEASSASFSSDMVGAVIRFGTSSTKPSGVRGLNPWVEQRIITAYTDANTVTVDSAPSATFSNVKYVVSDPVDLRPTMIEAFLRGCEWKLSLSRRNAESPPTELHQWYMEAIRIAGEVEATVEPSWTPPAMYNRGIQAIVTPSVSG